MVSLWPWKAEDNSPASFEKRLSSLSTKITQTTTRLDSHRQTSRRFRALWTLYASFIYILYSLISLLVVGWERYGLREIPALISGPVIIYTVRAAATRIFDYRIAKTSQHLDDLHKERDETIEKLKAATKYNSTQKLLEKYGGETPEKPRSKDEKRKSDSRRKPSGQQQQQQQQPVQRTGIAPPPTANIRRQSPIQPPSTPQNYPPPSPYLGQPSPQPQASPFSPQSPQSPDAPGFAPNAFPSAPQYIEQSHWYDRLFDALLGEDETQAKNRIVLICQNCRLVNGQAPPGVKTLEGLGRWRCGSCGAWNGESETAKALANIRRLSAKESVKAEEGDFVSSVGDVTDEGVIVGASEEEQMESDAEESGEEPTAESTAVSHEPEPEPEQETNRRTTRSRARANKKKG